MGIYYANIGKSNAKKTGNDMETSFGVYRCMELASCEHAMKDGKDGNYYTRFRAYSCTYSLGNGKVHENSCKKTIGTNMDPGSPK